VLRLRKTKSPEGRRYSQKERKVCLNRSESVRKKSREEAQVRGGQPGRSRKGSNRFWELLMLKLVRSRQHCGDSRDSSASVPPGEVGRNPACNRGGWRKFKWGIQHGSGSCGGLRKNSEEQDLGRKVFEHFITIFGNKGACPRLKIETAWPL